MKYLALLGRHVPISILLVFFPLNCVWFHKARSLELAHDCSHYGQEAEKILGMTLLRLGDLDPDVRAEFFRAESHRDIGCLAADFRGVGAHQYAFLMIGMDRGLRLVVWDPHGGTSGPRIIDQGVGVVGGTWFEVLKPGEIPVWCECGKSLSYQLVNPAIGIFFRNGMASEAYLWLSAQNAVNDSAIRRETDYVWRKDDDFVVIQMSD